MLRRLKTVLALGAITLIGAAATGCGGSSDDKASAGGGAAAATTEAAAPDKPIRIAYFNWLKANTFTQGNLKGVQEVAAEHGATVQEFDAVADVKKQVAQIQDAVTSGDFDAFIVVPVSSAVGPALKKAMAAGIEVGTTNLPVGDPAKNEALPGSVISVTQSYGQRGEAMADLMIGACKAAGKEGACKAAYVYGVTALPIERAQIDGLNARLKQHPNIKLVKSVPAGAYDRATGRKAAQDILQTHPDIDVITSVGDQMALGSEDAVKAAGKTKQVQITGEGASVLGKQAVQGKRWYGSVVNLVQTEGEITARAVIEAVRGEYTGPREPEIMDESPIGPLLLQTNAEGFEPQWAG